VEDNERTGHPGTAITDQNIERVREVIRGDRKLSVRVVAVS